ncbi:Chitin synthase 4 [Friedmanniomyces endolithicus]|nr:Chitin synthase 4 [Friedmanniomyces endolithicus]KAK0823829.1 Chitin synthase 4 [Friedmanniomyces endolithicus]
MAYAQVEEVRQLPSPISPARDPPSRPGMSDDARPITRDSPQWPSPQSSLLRKSIPKLEPNTVRLQGAPSSPVNVSPPRQGIQEPESAAFRGFGVSNGSRPVLRSVPTPDSGSQQDCLDSLPIRSRPSSGQVMGKYAQHSRTSSGSGPPRIEEFGPELELPSEEVSESPGLRYHAFDDEPRKQQTRKQNRVSQMTIQSGYSAGSSSSGGNRDSQLLAPRSAVLQRPASTYTLGSELRGRTLSPLSANGRLEQGSPRSFARDISSSRRSPSNRPMSYIDLLSDVPYNQQVAPGPHTNHAGLQSVIGNAASLLDTKKTLEMYRLNVKKTNNDAVQYEFAIFMINAARDCTPGDGSGLDPPELIQEAKHILQRLADRAYPFGQYYLADGYSSGLFNKDNRPDHDKAFPLFVAAAKHGHAEAGYRAALCYEFGWGTAKSYPKAIQFYRNSASKNHPGAATRLGLACLRGHMGLGRDRYREGLKWLKRAQESADFQYNSAPYELGVLHLSGFGDDVFKDEAYAAQLLTQAAELGHAEANLLMGKAYETGEYGCPRDPALSVHFYNGAATRGVAEAMMALCAWFMVGAEPVLNRDEGEAFAWAAKAADLGHPKAQYACGYFTEMGIGCRRDPLQANVWYVCAADQGYEAATQRLAIIRAAVAGEDTSGGVANRVPMAKGRAKTAELKGFGNGGVGANVNANGNGARKKVLGIF